MTPVRPNGSDYAETQPVTMADTMSPPPESDFADVRVRVTGGNLRAIGKWALIVLTGAGGVGGAATAVSSMATMAEQVKTLQADVAEVKVKTDQTAEDVAFIRGMFFPAPPPAPLPKPKRPRR